MIWISFYIISYIAILSNEFLAYDMNNDIVDLDSLDKPTFVIFYSWFSCKDCLFELEKEITNKFQNPNIAILISCNNDAITRKSFIKALNHSINSKTLLFDIHKSENRNIKNYADEGLFGKYNVTYTPALLILKGEKSVYYDFKSIFKDKKVIIFDN